MEETFLLFYVTHPDEVTARSIATVLLQERLVACANIIPITSAYWWEAAIAEGDEWVTILKTRLSLEEKVEEAIAQMHPDQTPCIMRFEVRANRAYQRWIEKNTLE